ncbi:hypothetical protein A5742_13900 [Mycolicibacterium fortuitum]|uniref:Integral membrane protein n=1 Tax=Mycolicibacterium fortuitum TaxID=1766 RepID=A0ABD6QD44_MYCFO|nr:hypothetical protein [Mycolicibacterium fortuitum]OMC34219.1 hypothetical protein A5742_13900 [Mycolicibacterium fortuitum]
MSPEARPQSVRWSVWCWLLAVASGVVETAIHVLSSDQYNVAVQLAVRVVVYLVVTLVILELYRGRGWARILLTVVLGGFGLVSLLVEPASWWAAGGSPGAFLAAADGPTLAVLAMRAVHVVAVVAALILMYRPSANRYFRGPVEEQVS